MFAFWNIHLFATDLMAHPELYFQQRSWDISLWIDIGLKKLVLRNKSWDISVEKAVSSWSLMISGMLSCCPTSDVGVTD